MLETRYINAKTPIPHAAEDPPVHQCLYKSVSKHGSKVALVSVLVPTLRVLFFHDLYQRYGHGLVGSPYGNAVHLRASWVSILFDIASSL